MTEMSHLFPTTVAEWRLLGVGGEPLAGTADQTIESGKKDERFLKCSCLTSCNADNSPTKVKLPQVV